MILFYLFIAFVFLFILNIAWDKLIRPFLHEDKIEGMIEDAKENYSIKSITKKIKETFKE